MISDKFVIIGVILNLWGCAVYARNTVRGVTKPNRITWFLWSLAPMIAFLAERNKGVGLVSLMTLSISIGPLMVLIASFMNKKSYWKLQPTDYLCGLLSILGLVLWIIYREANIAIVFSIAADILAALPTLVKSYRFPETESVEAYWPTIINSGIALLVIDSWTVANYGFPIYTFVINVIFVALIQFKLGLRLMKKPA
jgi:hypothetical protein